MSGLYLELGALKPTQSNIGPAVPNLMDLMQPEGFIPDLNLAESVSTAGSPLNPAKEAILPGGPAIIENNSADILSGVATSLDNISANLLKISNPITNSALNTVNNSLSISSELVKIEPKKVDLSIKDISALEDLITKVSTPKPTETKTTPDIVSTKTLTTTSDLPAPVNTPKLDISLFKNALTAQNDVLEENVNSIIESGGDLSELFKTTVTGNLENAKKSGELSDKFESSIKQAIEEKEKADALANQIAEGISANTNPLALTPLATIVNSPLKPVKEVEPPTFNKAIAKGLTDVAESNAKVVSQTNIVNQSQAGTQLVRSNPSTEPVNQMPNQPAKGEYEEEPNQQNVEVNSSDPVLASYMLQMLNIMKSGQLKVKFTQ